MAAPTPYLIAGEVLDDDNVTPRTNITLTARNERTFEEITTITDAGGQFVFDCANFANSYNDLDYVLIRTDTTGSNGQDLRIRIIARGLGQVNEIKVEYTTRT